MIYNVRVQWLQPVKGGYRLASKEVRNIRASSAKEASTLALARFKDRIYPTVSTVWYLWPQP